MKCSRCQADCGCSDERSQSTGTSLAGQQAGDPTEKADKSNETSDEFGWMAIDRSKDGRHDRDDSCRRCQHVDPHHAAKLAVLGAALAKGWRRLGHRADPCSMVHDVGWPVRSVIVSSTAKSSPNRVRPLYK